MFFRLSYQLSPKTHPQATQLDMPSSLSQGSFHKMEILLFFRLLQLAVIMAAVRIGG